MKMNPTSMPCLNVTSAKRLKAAVLATGLAAGVFTPQLLANYAGSFEGFDYATGNLNTQNGGTGWAGAWSVPTVVANSAVISTQSITYNFGGTVIGGGNSLLIRNGSNPLQRDVFAAPDTSGQDYYVSFIFNNTGTTFAGWQAKDGNVDLTNDTIGLTNNGTVGARVGNSTSTGATGFSDNATHFVVIAYTGWDGSTYRTSKVWLNPSAVGDPAASVSATYTGTAGQGSSGFMGLYIRTANFANDNTEFMYIDDIRVGTSWSSVTPIPEPSTTVLLTALGVCVGAVSRRKPRA